jgi:HSP20 family protein
MAQFPFIPSGESSELADDIRDVFEDLASSLKHDQRAYSGEYRPSLDVLETEEAVEIVVDVSGVPPEAIRVVFRAGVLIIAGEKAQEQGNAAHTFHLVEREFGRFARAVRLDGAFDIQRAQATLHDGELVIVMPKVSERRDRAHHIPVITGGSRT